MKKKLWSLTEVIESCGVKKEFVLELEQEELLWPVCSEDSPDKLFSSKDLENLRLAKILMEDMGVNLEGVEVILHMREMMFQMRFQFDDILEDLASNLRQKPG